MKAPSRSAFLVAGLAAALTAAVDPSVAGAQRNRVPGPDTKKVLVTAFRGDAEGGIRAADEIRNRIADEFNIKELMPTIKKDIDANLLQAGYRADSALNPSDIKELARLLRADEVIDGTVQKLPTGYRVSARMFLPRDAALSQPLVTVESANLGDVAKSVVDEYDKARKQIPDNGACENAIRANTPAVAIAAARKAITQYPKATIARLCLASAYESYKNTADSTGPWKDSVIAITKQILALDKTNTIALTQQYNAYKLKADTADALESLIGLMNADPTNSSRREQVIAELVQAGKAQMAVPTAKQLVVDNPGDPAYARTYWLVLRAAKDYKESVPAGVAYVTIDTAQADSNYFFRQVGDLSADSAFAKAAEMASTGSAKFPTNTTLIGMKAQNERRAGQLPAAKATFERLLQVDPKAPGVNYLLAQISLEQHNNDDVAKYARADAADPANKARDAALLLAVGNSLYRSADSSKSPEAYRKAIPLLQASDSLAPGAPAKFLIAVSAFQSVANSTDALKVSKSCDDFKMANDMLVLVNTNMMQGGSVSPENAKAILGAAPQYQTFIDGSMKKFCKP